MRLLADSRESAGKRDLSRAKRAGAIASIREGVAALAAGEAARGGGKEARRRAATGAAGMMGTATPGPELGGRVLARARGAEGAVDGVARGRRRRRGVRRGAAGFGVAGQKGGGFCGRLRRCISSSVHSACGSRVFSARCE